MKQLKYEIQLYFNGTGFVMPMVALIIFQFMLYSFFPLDVMSGYMVTCSVVFLIMIWVGMSVAQNENPVMEQILFLKVNNSLKYYLGKAMFMVVITLIVSIFCAVFPCIQNAIHNGLMFKRPVTLYDLGNVLLILTACGLCGAGVGSLLHPRLVANRKLAIASTVLLAVVAFCRYGIIGKCDVLKYILWVIPPIMLPDRTFGDCVYFDLGKSITIFGILTGYAVLYFLLKGILCNRNKF